MDWYDIKSLESPANLKSVIGESIQRTPSTTIASGISTCLQQGRFFFEAAENSPLEIKPLQVFYGVVSFSKAIAASRNIISTNSLAQSHGLKDISSSNSTLERHTIKIQQKGTFQEFNNAICKLESINYFGDENERQKIYKATCLANVISDKELTLKEIFSRTPSLSKIYQKTFNEESNCLSFSFYNRDSGLVDLRIDLPDYFHDRNSLKEMVLNLRSKYPFLSDWLLSSAQRCWDNSILIFSNVEFENINEFDESILVESDGAFDRSTGSLKIIPFGTLLPPIAGGILHNHPSYIKPIDGSDVSEYSIIYMGAFLLSSLVRYRPEVWVHSIKGRKTEQRGYDDHCMAMVERFLGDVLSTFPLFAKECIEVKLNN